MTPFTHICPHCASFLVAMNDHDMVELMASHLCATRQDRNQKLGWGFVAEDTEWRQAITVEDARLLKALRIDPL